jgi:AraC-like DNA-binding protein
LSLLARFIDSLHIYFRVASYWEVTQTVAVNGAVEPHNSIVLLDRGCMTAGDQQLEVQPQSFFFFPAGQPIHARFGSGVPLLMSPEEFADEERRRKLFLPISGLSDLSRRKEVIVAVSFDVLLYDAIPFFETLGIPPFPLVPDEEFSHLIRYIALEHEQSKLGREKILRNYMEEIIIHMCRYIERTPQFRRYVDRLEYLTDRRLVDIVQFVQSHLDADLSNKVLAGVAYVSEDYVGQFFKTLTGKNLQDYIEDQRLQLARRLLQTRPDSIQEISREVGFKDPAYFSRRFKLRFGVNANTVRNGGRAGDIIE